VIVHDLNISWARLGPDEADPITLVDPNAELTGSVSRKGLQSIAGGNPQILEITCRIKLLKLAGSDLPQASWAASSCRL
jgi:hypothetical protein